jgi:hypothetical protein
METRRGTAEIWEIRDRLGRVRCSVGDRTYAHSKPTDRRANSRIAWSVRLIGVMGLGGYQ